MSLFILHRLKTNKMLHDSKQQKENVYFYEPTMMLLMGIWINLTKKPMKPMIAKPMAVAMAIF